MAAVCRRGNRAECRRRIVGIFAVVARTPPDRRFNRAAARRFPAARPPRPHHQIRGQTRVADPNRTRTFTASVDCRRPLRPPSATSAHRHMGGVERGRDRRPARPRPSRHRRRAQTPPCRHTGHYRPAPLLAFRRQPAAQCPGQNRRRRFSDDLYRRPDIARLVKNII